MRYLCLLFGDAAVHQQQTRAESDAMKNDSLDYDQVDEAMEIAAKIPMARLWTVEVRPILELARA